MQEDGHYYTVYYTSLAVGFSDDIAQQHALLSQMADEVGALDAANLQSKQCLNIKEYNLNGAFEKVPFDDRALFQYAHHALVYNNSTNTTQTTKYQREQTTLALANEDADSLTFGLLLHRLGDTYAHSKIFFESEPYTINTTDKCGSDGFNFSSSFGHLHHGTIPDLPIFRKGLFFSYLQNLYDVLHNKILEQSSSKLKRGVSARSYSQVKNDFEFIFNQVHAKIAFAIGLTQFIALYNSKNIFIKQVRILSETRLLAPLNAYAPEKSGEIRLDQFLTQHTKILGKLAITPEKIYESTRRMIPKEGDPYPENTNGSASLERFLTTGRR